MCCDLNTIKMSGKTTYHGPAKSLPDFLTGGSSLVFLTRNQRSQKGPASGRTARLQEGRCNKGPGQGHKNLKMPDFYVKKFSVSGGFFVSKICAQKRPPKWPIRRDFWASAGDSGMNWKPCPLSRSPIVPKSPLKLHRIIRNRLKSSTRQFVRISRKASYWTPRMAIGRAAGGSWRSGLRSMAPRRPWLSSKAAPVSRKVTGKAKTSVRSYVCLTDKLVRSTHKTATMEAARGSERFGLRSLTQRRPWVVSKAVLVSRKVKRRAKTSTGLYVQLPDKILKDIMATKETARGSGRSGLRSLASRRPWLASKVGLVLGKVTGRLKTNTCTYTWLLIKASSCTSKRATREAAMGTRRLAVWSVALWKPPWSSKAVLSARKVTGKPMAKTGAHKGLNNKTSCCTYGMALEGAAGGSGRPAQWPVAPSKPWVSSEAVPMVRKVTEKPKPSIGFSTSKNSQEKGVWVVALQGGTKPLPLKGVAGVGLLGELQLRAHKIDKTRKNLNINRISKIHYSSETQLSAHLNPAVVLVCLQPRKGDKGIESQNEAST